MNLGKVARTNPKRKIYNGICHEFIIYCLWKGGYLTKDQGDGIIAAWAVAQDIHKYGTTLPIKTHGVAVAEANMGTVSQTRGRIIGFYGGDWLGHTMVTAGTKLLSTTGRLAGVNNASVMAVDTKWHCKNHTDLLWTGGQGVGANGYTPYLVDPQTLVDNMP